jgi:cytoskeletal protein CcmA (bactofilin family)
MRGNGEDLTIGGRFKGTIQANRVTLTSSAVVEGEIHAIGLLFQSGGFADARLAQQGE